MKKCETVNQWMILRWNQHLRGMSVQSNKSEISFSGSQKVGVQGFGSWATPLHLVSLWVLIPQSVVWQTRAKSDWLTFWPQALHLGPVLISTSPVCSSRSETTGGGASTTQTSSFTFKMSNSITFFWRGRHEWFALRNLITNSRSSVSTGSFPKSFS